jgi:hypothetical protein
MSAALTRSERQDPLQLIRQRERVAKTAAADRAAQLRAEFETQLDTKYRFDTNEIWTAANAQAQAAAAAAQAAVQAECERLGIPPEFAPSIGPPCWYSRGENMVRERRIELRRLARMHIEASEKAACSQIARASVEAQTAVIANGLSDAGLAFLESLPTAVAMMPTMEIAAVERLLPPRGGRQT